VTRQNRLSALDLHLKRIFHCPGWQGTSPVWGGIFVDQTIKTSQAPYGAASACFSSGARIQVVAEYYKYSAPSGASGSFADRRHRRDAPIEKHAVKRSKDRAPFWIGDRRIGVRLFLQKEFPGREQRI